MKTIKKYKRAFIFAGILLILAVLSALILPRVMPQRGDSHGIYPEISKAEMVQQADLIVKGTFVSCGAPYNVVTGDKTAVYQYSRARFQITEVLKGAVAPLSEIDIRLDTSAANASSTFSLKQNRSTADHADSITLQTGTTLSADGSTEYLLILRSPTSDTDPGDYYTPFYSEHGIFFLEEGIWSNFESPYSYTDTTLNAEIQTLLTESVETK